MPIKHQSDSYRHRRGERYTCWTDCLEGDTRAEAKKIVHEARSVNVRAFAEHVKDEGYSRVFVHVQDAIKAGWLKEPGVNVTMASIGIMKL